MTATAKFLFDNDFARDSRAGLRPVSAAQHQAALAEAEARGYVTGLVAGRAEAADTDRQKLTSAIERAAADLATLADELPALQARLETETVEIAAAVAGKLAPALIGREPFAEIAALASECFRHLIGVPHVVVRVGEGQYDTAKAQLDDIAAAAGFAGRLVVLAAPEIAVGDCRVEWADGGVVRDRAAVAATIAAAVERYVAVRAGQPAHSSENRNTAHD